MDSLSQDQLDRLTEATFRKTAQISLEHARKNLPRVRKTLADLPRDREFPSAVIVSAGPSLHRQDPARLLKDYDGAIISADGALGYLLRNGVVPHYVVSVDPHPDRIVRWFGDTKLASRRPDDYFRRQDLDPHHENERRANDELIALVDRHGRGMRAALATSVSPDIAQRCAEAGIEVYWWNPIFDDYDSPGSLTRELYELTKAPCLVTGGNVGASAWAFAYAALGIRRTALVGMDFSYAPGTPIEKTQYFEVIRELYADDPAKAYIHVDNPHLGQTWMTDPAYYWYRENFLRLATAAEDAEIFNCTEGGILFGDNIHFVPLRDFLTKRALAAGGGHR